jgi:hypothetical protein
MRPDTIEFGLTSVTRSERRSPRARVRDLAGQRESDVLPPEVVDEALAGFEQVADSTREGGADTTGDWRPIKKSLVANLAAQLESLDRQRDQLAQLLRNIDSALVSE